GREVRAGAGLPEFGRINALSVARRQELWRARKAPQDGSRRRGVSAGNDPLLTVALDPNSQLPRSQLMVGFPLLLIPLAVFNIIAFLMPDVAPTVTLFRLHLMSGTEWPVTLSDVLIALGMLLLLLEVIKGARPGAKFLMDHLLSLVVFGAAGAEFVLWPKFGNSTFFLLTLLALVDFLSGIALRVRRSVQYALVPVSTPREKKRAAAARAEDKEQERQYDQRIEPTPAMPSPAPAQPANQTRPSAASVAESVLSDHPAPKPPQAESPPQPEPAAPSAEHSPQVASPELQPTNSSTATPDEPQR